MRCSESCVYHCQGIPALCVPHPSVVTSFPSHSKIPIVAHTPPHPTDHLPLPARENPLSNKSLLNLIRHPPKQRLTLAILPIRLRVRHDLPLSLTNLRNPPSPLLFRLLKELQVLIEAASTSLRHVEEGPHAGEQVCGGEDGEELVGQVVEEDGREERDSEVGEAPDDDADGGALGTGGCWVDFGGDEPGGCEPGYAEGCGGDEEGL